ncbi:MAG: TRAP transporter substrate-binding protein DctP [Pseudomonadota bacterium]
MIRCILAVAVIFLGAIGFRSDAAAEPITIKFSTLAPKNSGTVYETIKKEIKEQTHNEVNFKVYYGGIQGDDYDVIKKMKLGQLQGGSITAHGLGEIVPEVRLLELPYLFRNMEEVTHVRKEMEPDLVRKFSEAGYIHLNWYDIGFNHVFTKIPITSIEIARQQKWWMWEGDILYQTIYDSLQISPVYLSLTDVLTSLSTKLIDAAPAPPYAAIAFRWQNKFSYMDERPISSSFGAMIVKKSLWDQIPPKNQSIIQEIFKTHINRATQVNHDRYLQCISALKQGGIEVVRNPADSDMEKHLLEAGIKTREALAGKLYSRELLDKMMSILENYRKQHPDSRILALD